MLDIDNKRFNILINFDCAFPTDVWSTFTISAGSFKLKCSLNSEDNCSSNTPVCSDISLSWISFNFSATPKFKNSLCNCFFIVGSVALLSNVLKNWIQLI